MRCRWLTACGLGLLSVSPALADITLVEAAPPTELPPLLPVVPEGPAAPKPTQAPPRGDYDQGYLYLPDRAPDGPKLPPCPCRPLGRWWVSPELELGWLQGPRLPPLVRNGTSLLYGGDRLPNSFRAGFGLTAGGWFNRCQTSGVEGSFFYLGQGGSGTTITSATLLLPTSTGTFTLSDPTAGYVGAYQLGLATHYATADVNFRQNLYCETNTRIDLILGYRYARLGDALDLYGKRLGPGGEIVRFRDQVEATNNYHAGQVGLAAEQRFGEWYVGGTTTVAFGSVFSDTDLHGQFRVNGTVVPNGFYARPDVAGTRDRTRFAVMPVVKLTLGRQIGEHARVYAGYQFQFLDRLTRAGDVLDPLPNINPTDPQNPALPAAMSQRRDAPTSSLWVQSLNFGFEVRY